MQKSRRPEDDILRAFSKEIIAFSHPAVKRHRNVLDLEGICWDIETEDEGNKIWPVLMFEKSQYGDLTTFLARPTGRELSADEKLSLCLDIAWAVSDMHMHDIIHGDIKPANALVFRNDKRYTAKLMDFGLSYRDAGEHHPVFVAGSWPWTAPELDKNYCTVAQAKCMDIFSFGMLCFWTLFEKNFQGELPLPAETYQTGQGCASQQRQTLNMAVFNQLKHSDRLPILAKQLIRDEPSFDEDDKPKLERFFDKALSRDPEDRCDALESLFPFKEHSHHLLWTFIRWIIASDDTYGSFWSIDSLPHLTLTLHFNLRYATISDLAAQERKKEERNFGKIVYALRKSGHFFSVPPAAQTLQGAMIAMQHESKDLESSLGKKSKLWLINAGNLARIYKHLGRWKDSEELRKELMLIIRTLVSEDDQSMLEIKQDLAEMHRHFQRYQEAQELQRQVVDSNTKSLGKSHETTLTSLSNLASVYEDQERWKEAKEIHLFIIDERRKVLGEEHMDTLQNMDSLAWIYNKQDLWEESRELWLRIVEISKRVLGHEHPQSLVHRGHLAGAYTERGYLQEARELQEQILETTKRLFGEKHPQTLMSLGTLAGTLWRQGAHLQGESLLRKVLALTEDHLKEESFFWYSTASLGRIALLNGNHTEAKSINQEILVTGTKVHGMKHPLTMDSMRSLARTFATKEEYAEAELLFRNLVALTKDTETAPAATLADSTELATMLFKQGNYDQAELMYRNILATLRVESRDNPSTWKAMNNLALTFQQQGRFREAEQLYRESFLHLETMYGKDDHRTRASMHNLATIYHDLGDFVKGESLLQDLLVIKTRIEGKEHPSTLTTANSLGMALVASGKLQEAQRILDRNLLLRKKVLSTEHTDTLISMRNLVTALLQQGDHAGAERISREEISLSEKKFGKNDGRLLVSINLLAKIHIGQGRFVEAENALRVAVARQEKRSGKTHPGTLRMRNNLAEALNGQKKWVEAQKMHQSILRSRLAVLGAKHPDTLRSVVNLSNTLRDQGKHGEALKGYEQAWKTYCDTLGPDHPDALACEKHCAYSQQQVNEQILLPSEQENPKAGSEVGQSTSKSETEMTEMMQETRL
ncbi:hypothetical protein E8E13_005545 [Curvularia kusanoi]|uniref:Protein kinase domain-containing protein n=1 Tax=Curvularia kusanoi TaxID=90978 RepID=A0A9P4W5Q1_CURKU|nr:hypothetical protein E8E13_005545 [Curvularia kusanoi]